jgi:hypothetical protein
MTAEYGIAVYKNLGPASEGDVKARGVSFAALAFFAPSRSSVAFSGADN